MSPIFDRLKLFGLAAVLLILGLVMIGAGTSVLDIDCARASGACRWQAGSLFDSTDIRFAVTDVREVRFVDEIGKNKRDGAVVLVLATGSDTQYGRARRDVARARYEEARAFFERKTTASYRFTTSGSRLFVIGGIALLLGAVGAAVRAARKRLERGPSSEPTGRATRWRRTGVLAAIAAAGLAIVLAVAARSTRDQGVLTLHCKTRCEFQGTECTRGTLTVNLDPGDYTVAVWQSTGPARWAPRAFTIEQGRTTLVVCE